MEITKGMTGKFVQLGYSDGSKIFIVPPFANLEAKVAGLLQTAPGVVLAHTGSAMVTSIDETINVDTDEIPGLPSGVDKSMQVQFQGTHPMLVEGTIRYSKALADAIEQAVPVAIVQPQVVPAGQTTIYDTMPQAQVAQPVQPTIVQQPAVVQQPVQEAKPKLADTLRQQMAQKVLDNTAQKKQEEELKTAVQVVQTPATTQVPQTQADITTTPASVTQPTTAEEKAAAPIVIPDPEKKEEPVKTLQSHPAKAQTLQDQLNKKLATKQEQKETDSDSLVGYEMKRMSKIDQLIVKVDRIQTELGIQPVATAQDLKEWFWNHMETVGETETFEKLAARMVK